MHETREGRPESAPLLLAWGMPANDGQEGFLDNLGLWLTGGAGLLLWTALALWLTA